MDSERNRGLPNAIEVHTVELTKYNLDEETIGAATAIEQWAFFFLLANRYEPARLRGLLPGAEFQRAIAVVETMAAKTEDRLMYDQREKPNGTNGGRAERALPTPVARERLEDLA